MNNENTLEHLGAILHYWITGDNDAPLIVFTHGACLDHHMFATQIPPLVNAGYRVMTWDLRGHGQSKPMGTRFTLQTAAEDLFAIINHMDIEKATFIGHSFGGYITQEFTYRHPERVAAMGVIGCTDLAAKPSWLMSFASKIMPFMLPRMSLESFRKRTIENVSIKEEITKAAYEATGALSKEDYLDVIMAGVDCLSVDAGYGDAYTIPKPFLLTHGQLDKANGGIFPKSAVAWAKKEPNCTYEVVTHAGHTANQDNPEAFNAILLDFLTNHVPA